MKNPPRLSWLSELRVIYNGNTGGYDVVVKGAGVRGGGGGDELEWKDNVLFLQGAEEIIKSIRINSSL